MYTWKEGRSHPVGANVVGKAVDRIIKRDGVCKPLALVEAARPDDSPLHPLFEWRNDAAAEKWRTHQARHLLSALRVVVVKGASPAQPPAFLSVRITSSDEEGEAGDEGYHAIRVVEQDPALRRAAVLREWKFLRGYLERVAWIDEFAPLWPAVAAVEQALFAAPEPAAEPMTAAAD